MSFLPLWIFFGDCLPGVEFPAETQGLLVQPHIDLDKREMHLDFKADQWIEPTAVHALCANVAKATNCRVNHSIAFAPACFGSQAFGWLLQKLRESIVVVNGFLHTTEITYEPPRLLLHTSPTGKKVLDDADAAAWLQRFVQKHFDLTIVTELLAAEEKAFVPPVEDTLPCEAADMSRTAGADTSRTAGAVGAAGAPQSLLFSFHNSKLLYGTVVQGLPVPIFTLEAADGPAVICGEVFGLKVNKTKDGTRHIITFHITDFTGSVPCKLFEKTESAAPLLEGIKDGACLLLKGHQEFDNFSKGYVFRPKGVMTAAPVLPEDLAEEKRVELHLHTNMSEMDGLCDVKKLVKRAAAWGHKAIAITDHGVAQAFPGAMEAGHAHGIKILYGM
ncbi:MAG: PHP domain-containing protein, partial [Oscillospiraceae bacterium]|nr:PHP domain-containing protein [Oscillospiraceae bacterium]